MVIFYISKNANGLKSHTLIHMCSPRQIKNEYESNFQYALISRSSVSVIPVKIIALDGSSANSDDNSPLNASVKDVPIIRQKTSPLKMSSSSSFFLKYLFVFFPAYTFTMLSPPFCRFSAISPGEIMINEKRIFSANTIPK